MNHDHDLDIIERGHFSFAAPAQRKPRRKPWRLTAMVIIGVIFCVSFVIDYVSEYQRIQILKESLHSLTQCTSTTTSSGITTQFLEHLTGYTQRQAEECEEQIRIAALYCMPNPLLIAVNLLWKSFAGETIGVTLTRFLVQQSYLAQISIVVCTATVIGLLVYQILRSIININRELTVYPTQVKQLRFTPYVKQQRKRLQQQQQMKDLFIV